MAALLQALKVEMAMRRDYVFLPKTLYVGGGTPSLYKAAELGGLIQEAKRLWGDHFTEVTVELNPEDVTVDYCTMLVDHGVNRMSIGIQSFTNDHLRWMNRRHCAEQGVRAVEAVRKAGCQNVSIDLIFGFPGLSDREWSAHIAQALALAPEHLSAYQLGIECGTPLFAMAQKGLLRPVAQEVAANQYAMLQELLPAAGLLQYEVSNFAREGYRSQHNSSYWQGIHYLGLGPSAHSFNGVARHANVRLLGRYLTGVHEGVLQKFQKEERTTRRKRYNEFVMTRLRTLEGVSRRELQAFADDKVWNHFERESARLVQYGLLVEKEGAVVIPPQKWFISDGIITQLMM